ncbi:Anti-sigma factor antagonist [uncultured Sporomusa sp.]|uniref:Anti-sigma factor antagonist n=1 Tax=uncultured Sporomusa sp. TaxID=307249 RepID=A0A212LV81_9FIRM|nr:STAS domain-containing protein [uncultured Sporomusa sp.]SCM81525.1 Anti-sigma factor antagonist [uncultured Sporomusa sp.]
MRISTSIINNQVIVDLAGSMYVEGAEILREKLIKHVESGEKHFLIKMDKVDYIDSSGLGVLVSIHKRTRQCNGSLVISGTTGFVKELFELTRLDKVFDMQ